MGLFPIFGTDSCGASTECDLDRFTTGWLASMVIPIAGFVVTLVVTIIRLARGRRAFWVPLAGTGAFVLGFVAAVAFAFSGLG
jgi:cytochrome c oxidase assembly factor CtaG